MYCGIFFFFFFFFFGSFEIKSRPTKCHSLHGHDLSRLPFSRMFLCNIPLDTKSRFSHQS